MIREKRGPKIKYILKAIKTQLIQILFFPIHSNVIPFVCVFTSFINVQERFSKT